MKLLVVEDDPTIASFVAQGLQAEGYAVDHAATGPQGLQMATNQPYDAAVVDVMLPGMDGLGLVEELRRRRVTLPVLMLSARHTVDDRVRGLRAGGDDYLAKPFAFPELLARVEALIRRSSGRAEPTRLRVGGLELDLAAHTATRDGRPLDLRPREFTLLALLMRNADRVVSKSMILSHVWDYHFDPRTNVVDVLVHRLREKLDRDFEVKMLQTVRGAGYVLRSS